MMFRVDSRINGNRWFTQYASDVYSQCGEDGIIKEIFSRIGLRSRWCVEIGAGDGVEISNTRSLIENGWFAVMIEGNKNKAVELQRNYAGNNRVTCVDAMVDIRGLDGVLAKTDIPSLFDFLCIDIDGCDWYMWEAMKEYRARVIMIEFNPTFSNNVLFVQQPDPNLLMGASLRAMIDLGRGKGYELVASTSFNALFVDADEFSAVGVSDNSIDAIYDDSPFTPVVFQSYEGKMISIRTPKIWEIHHG